jgi:two-component system, response regulator
MSDSEEVEIVVVEDNPNDAELIIRVLRKNNLANGLVLLKDGEEALVYLFAQKGFAGKSIYETLKVVVLDLKLPKVDGIEVLRRIRSDERTRFVPVVVLTSSAVNQDLKEAYRLGANSYVTKPIKYADFSKLVADAGAYWLVLNRLPDW